MSQAGSFNNGSTPPPANSIQTITGNTGGPVGPDVGGNVDLIGDGVVISVAGTPGINTLEIDIATATTTNEGVVQLATDAQTIAGSATDVVITPSNLTAKLGVQTDHAVAIGDTTTGALHWSNAGTNGQVLLGANGADPAFATLTSTGGTILFTPGANSLNLEASGGSGSGITVDADTGSAMPIANVLTLKGAVGGNISTVGSSNNLTVAVSGTTNHAVQVGNTSGSLTSVGPGTTNTVLLGNTGSDPSFGQVPNGALVNNSITFNNGNSINCSPSGAVALGSAVTINVSGTTPHAVQVGAVAGGLSNVAVGTTNTVLLGNTGADPSFGKVPNGALVSSSITINGDQNISVTGSPVSLGGAVSLSFPDVDQYKLLTADGSGVVESLPAGTGTAGQVLTSNGAAAYPTWASAPASSSVITTEFTSSGTWTPNPSAKMAQFVLIGGGGGGGSGACGNSGLSSGGGGGGVGGVAVFSLPSFLLGSQAITIGAAGTGGASVVDVVPTAGNNGGIGGRSYIGDIATYLSPITSNNGKGGPITGSTGQGGNVAQFVGDQSFNPVSSGSSFGSQGGVGTPSAGGNGNADFNFLLIGPGGGGAGANSTTAFAGGSVNPRNTAGASVGTPSAGGIETGTIDGANGVGVSSSGFPCFGMGGGGGGGQKSGTRGGNGGNAGGYGSGGGGGGGSLLGFASGAGGNGKPGYCLVIEYL